MEDKSPLNDDIAMDINADADIPGNTHLSNSESERLLEIEKLASELQEQKDKYLRLVAEFDNYKRRSAKERNDFAQTAGKERAAEYFSQERNTLQLDSTDRQK